MGRERRHCAGLRRGRSWKATAIVLAAVLVEVTGAAGTGWWLAAGDRDLACAALLADQGVSAALRTLIAEQNLAVDGMARATLAAQQRGEAAQAAAAAAEVQRGAGAAGRRTRHDLRRGHAGR